MDSPIAIIAMVLMINRILRLPRTILPRNIATSMAFIHDAAMAAYRLPIDYVNQQKSLLLMATDLGFEIVTSAAG